MYDFNSRVATLTKELQDLKALKNMATTEIEIDMIYKRLDICNKEHADLLDDLEFDDHIENLSEHNNLIER